MPSPTEEIDLEPRMAGDSWDIDITITGDFTVPGYIVFCTIKREKGLPDPGYAQRWSTEGGVEVLEASATRGRFRFKFTAEETVATREAADGEIFYDAGVNSTGTRKTTTQWGRIPVLHDITERQP